MLRRFAATVLFSVRGGPWQKRRMLWGSVEPSSALELGWLVGVVVVVVVVMVDGG
jgi:hypothetical protein